MSDTTDYSTQPKPANQPKRPRSPIGIIIAVCVVLAIVIIVFNAKVRHLNATASDAQTQLTQAKTQAAQAQADLDKAKAQSADLQSQLDKSKSQLSDLQSQVEQSKNTAADLQSQVDKAKAQLADLQSQLDKAKQQSADVQSELDQANTQSAERLTQLDQAKSQAMDLQSQLNNAQSDIAALRPLAVRARHMPISTSLDKSFWSSSFTLHISNSYPQPISVNISVTGPGKPRSQSNVIAGGGTLDVEKLSAGEKVVITADGYDPVNVAVQ
jgi:hypothetical protein